MDKSRNNGRVNATRKRQNDATVTNLLANLCHLLLNDVVHGPRGLKADGWRVHVIWECELKKKAVENTFARLIPQLREELGAHLDRVMSKAWRKWDAR